MTLSEAWMKGRNEIRALIYLIIAFSYLKKAKKAAYKMNKRLAEAFCAVALEYERLAKCGIEEDREG